ncbi:MAG: phosphate uptake regulator PhoU [Euryarchaeota archaeon]|nr:phosphate uptake regulator PhoU [Euryarchaeota archaeon]
MELRKVQVTGGSSYIISLPKAWVKKMGIEKNDSVEVHVQNDDSLLIIPAGGKKENENRVKIFRADEMVDENFLMRCLIGAYVSGYREIKIISSEPVESWVRDTVTQFSRLVIGQEIIEETANTIVMRDILDPAELPFEKILRRMHIIVRSMYEDSIKILDSKNQLLVKEVIRRDSEVDRLHWLIAREQSIMFSDPGIAQKVNLGSERCIDYFQISKIIERIGDHTARIARNSGEIINTIDKQTIKLIKEAAKFALNIFDMSIDAYRKKDIFMAERILEKVSTLKEQCESINSNALEYGTGTAIALGYIAESIRRTGEYSADLCEYVIDYFI